jgi:hypothetical protein
MAEMGFLLHGASPSPRSREGYGELWGGGREEEDRRMRSELCGLLGFEPKTIFLFCFG